MQIATIVVFNRSLINFFTSLLKQIWENTTMIIFPQKNNNIIEVDQFRELRYCLRLWVQRKEFLPIGLVVYAFKLFGFISRTIFILKSTNNLDMLLEISATYPIPLLAVAKMGYLLIKQKTAAFLYSAVKNDFWDYNIGGKVLQNRIQKRFKFINILLLNHATISTLYVICHLIFPYIPIPEGRTRWLPTLIVFPWNQDKSPIYEILFVILSFNMFVSVFGNGVFDLFFVYAAQHLCGQLILLKKLLRNLDYGLMEGCGDVEKFKSKYFQREIQKRIAICVRHHNLLLRYGEELKNLTSLLFGVQLLTTWVTLVLLGYKLSQDLEEITKSTMLISFVLSSTMQFSIFAIQSEDLRTQSVSVAVAAYQCNWFLFNSTAKRALTLLIMNSQEGISMVGAGLTNMNNEILVDMMQKVFSCITLLQSLGEQGSE